MKKWIAILSGLLLAQLVLAVALNLDGDKYGAFQPTEPLLTFDPKAVNRLRIDDGKRKITLQKQEGRWLILESDEFPADGKVVEQLLDKLAALRKGWPVATTAGAARRFKVDDQQFERKLQLFAGDAALATLYVGTSPGFRKVHVRPAGESAVYAVTLNSWEIETDSDDWIDKQVLSLHKEEIERIELPDVTLQRQEGVLRVADHADNEETASEQVQQLLDKLAGLRIQSILGTTSKPEYGQEKPELLLKVRLKVGKELSYRFSRPKKGGYDVLKRSDRKHYFKVARYVVDSLKGFTREKLVQVRKQPDSKPGEVPKPDTAPVTKEVTTDSATEPARSAP